MARDASLDEFLGVDPDGKVEEGADDGGTARSAAEGDDGEPTVDAAVDPVRPVVQWRPEGAACAACGARVERRWRVGDDLVCGDCKDW